MTQPRAAARTAGARVKQRIDRARAQRLQARLAGPKLIREFAAAFPAAMFVEIGANDGEQHDHLRPMILARRWRGIMVEPVPYVFERLRTNYGGLDRVVLENVAVADEDGSRRFYHLAASADRVGEGLPQWYELDPFPARRFWTTLG
jgi:hypothetical protein